MRENCYRGRFAPSPSGPLHLGSLYTAIASYLEAKQRQGEWLLRIEDLDPPREPVGTTDDILRTLEHYGFQWDGEVTYQSQRHEHYQNALNILTTQDLIYPCTCSRKHLQAHSRQGTYGLIYPGYCRNQQPQKNQPYALRVKTTDSTVTFHDAIQGSHSQNIAKDVGDFILRRKDNLFAYQLAVVVDDEAQGITNIVRGSDLLTNTPRQRYLQSLLKYQPCHYMHLPILTHPHGHKLSKQTFALAIPKKQAAKYLTLCLSHLGQKPPNTLSNASVTRVWEWATESWRSEKVPRTLSFTVQETLDND